VSSAHPHLPCKRVVEIVTDYMEGKLDPAEHGQLEQHLLLCDPCVQYIEQTRSVARALRDLPQPPVSQAAHQAALAALRRLKAQDEP
jgi:anti-sigma factor RsiW